MNKIKRILILLFLIIFIPITANAEELKSFDIVSVSDEGYNLNFRVNNDKIPVAYTGKKLSDYILAPQHSTYKGEVTVGYYEWENDDYIIVDGEQEVTAIYYDGYYRSEIEVTIYINGISQEQYKQEQKSKSITLTESELKLKQKETFDINIRNKIKGSTYKWTTSNKKVATINNKNGVVTGVKKGKAVITCTITTPNGDILKLKCNVTIK